MSFLWRTLYFDNWPIVLFQRVFYRRARLVAFRRGPIEFVVDYSGGDQVSQASIDVTGSFVVCVSGNVNNVLRDLRLA